MFSRREGCQRPCVAAQANGNRWQFWSACANHHALVGVARPDTSADAWRLACDAKRLQKPDRHDEVGCAMVRASAACLVAVVCLS